MWVFNRLAGTLTSPNGEVFAGIYSGHGNGVNNPSFECVKNVGPIPSGVWIIGEMENTAEHGPDALPLTPDVFTQTYGRSDFMCHGDEVNHPGQHLASLGCVIAPLNVRKQMSGKLQVI